MSGHQCLSSGSTLCSSVFRLHRAVHSFPTRCFSCNTPAAPRIYSCCLQGGLPSGRSGCGAKYECALCAVVPCVYVLYVLWCMCMCAVCVVVPCVYVLSVLWCKGYMCGTCLRACVWMLSVFWCDGDVFTSEEHTSILQSHHIMSYANYRVKITLNSSHLMSTRRPCYV